MEIIKNADGRSYMVSFKKLSNVAKTLAFNSKLDILKNLTIDEPEKLARKIARDHRDNLDVLNWLELNVPIKSFRFLAKKPNTLQYVLSNYTIDRMELFDSFTDQWWTLGCYDMTDFKHESKSYKWDRGLCEIERRMFHKPPQMVTIKDILSSIKIIMTDELSKKTPKISKYIGFHNEKSDEDIERIMEAWGGVEDDEGDDKDYYEGDDKDYYEGDDEECEDKLFSDLVDYAFFNGITVILKDIPSDRLATALCKYGMFDEFKKIELEDPINLIFFLNRMEDCGVELIKWIINRYDVTDHRRLENLNFVGSEELLEILNVNKQKIFSDSFCKVLYVNRKKHNEGVTLADGDEPIYDFNRKLQKILNILVDGDKKGELYITNEMKNAVCRNIKYRIYNYNGMESVWNMLEKLFVKIFKHRIENFFMFPEDVIVKIGEFVLMGNMKDYEYKDDPLYEIDPDDESEEEDSDEDSD